MSDLDPSGKKISRNSLCWCDSKKKYKNCHGKPSAKIPLGKLDQIYEKEKKKNKCCMHPSAGEGCSDQIIKAHSVRRSGDLKSIAVNGHVYMYSKPSLQSIDAADGKLEAKLVGINHATTFTGMCSIHDDELFTPLEKKKILPDREQLALLMYRAHLKELFHKKDAKYSDTMQDAVKANKNAEQQLDAHLFLKYMEHQLDLGARDIDYIVNQLNQWMPDLSRSEIDSVIIRFDSQLPFLCSSSFAPAMGLDGQFFGDHWNTDEVLPRISYTAINEDGKGIIAISWLSSHRQICLPYVRSMLGQHKESIASRLLECAVRYAENTCFNPDWMNLIDESSRELIDEAMMFGTGIPHDNALDCWFYEPIPLDSFPSIECIEYDPREVKEAKRIFGSVADLMDVVNHWNLSL